VIDGMKVRLIRILAAASSLAALVVAGSATFKVG
jgi:hypothetical protein